MANPNPQSWGGGGMAPPVFKEMPSFSRHSEKTQKVITQEKAALTEVIGALHKEIEVKDKQVQKLSDETVKLRHLKSVVAVRSHTEAFYRDQRLELQVSLNS